MTTAPGPYLSAAAPQQDGVPDWDVVAELWKAAPSQALWRRYSDEVNSALARRWLPPRSGTMLKTDLWDEAMGDGLYPSLVERADRVVGVDVSAQIVAAARLRYPKLEALIAEIRRLPLEAGSVDAVVSNSTLDHFETREEIDASVRELARVLRPGGTLLLTLDNPLNPLVAILRAIPSRHLNRVWLRLGPLTARVGLAPYHVGATYARRPLVSLLAAAGFRVEEETTLVHSPRVLAVLAGRVLERRGGPEVQERFLGLLRSTERLGALPTRYLTGYFFGVRATRL